MMKNSNYNLPISKEKEKDEIKNGLKERLKNDEELLKMIRDINGIEILNFLDSGSESNVYHISISSKDKNKKNDKKDAIMKLIIDKRKSKKKEIYISEILKNKNIICCYTHSFLDDQGESPFLIMEYAKYGNLRNFNDKVLKRTFFSESLICYLAYQILNGIKYMHICKVAHMDLKPHIKLPFVGTNFYMSPEILKSDTIKVKDLHKVDLYSFGVILYNLAFAKYPYGLEKEDAHNYKIILEKIETNELTFPNTEDYSSYFLDFLSKLLEKDIEKRMNMSDALNNYWINGGRLLLNEQEKVYNAGVFLSYLLTDHISDFNSYINQSK